MRSDHGPEEYENIEVVRKYGNCYICSNRVYADEDHVVASEGYCHKTCLNKAITTTA